MLNKIESEKKQILEDDLKYIWHPFTQMKDYEKEEKPIVIVKGEGVYLEDIDGNRYIDSVSSWWTNTLGHCNSRLNRALKEQSETLEHVIFAGFTHPKAVELAKQLVEMTCKRLTKVFFSDNGSTAVEVALKMAYQYFYQTGRPQKRKFVAFKNSYHGDTLGAVSVGGVDLYHKIYKPLLFEIFQAQNPNCYRCPKGLEKQSCNCECICFVEEIFKSHRDEIAGIIIEPLIQGAGGMVMYRSEYLTKLRELCDRYEILLIDDEVALAFGRTGKMFAYEHAKNVEPDIMCLAKGITAGYMPLSVTMASDEIYSAFYDDWDKAKTFFHGHSYTANPLACCVALENLKIHKEENIVKMAQRKGKLLLNMLEPFRDLEFVGDVRSIGMIAAVELVKNKETKEIFDPNLRIGLEVYKEALKFGVILRPLENVIYFMPPLIIEENQMEKMVEAAYKSVKIVSERFKKFL